MAKLSIGSSEFETGTALPSECTCDGDSVSPALFIDGVPEKTASLALIVDDPDAPSGTFTHWLMWNMPSDTKTIPAGGEVAGAKGMNSAGTLKYAPPCPPFGTHRYYFRLYALDKMIDLREGARREQLESQIAGHVIEQAETMGTYTRKR